MTYHHQWLRILTACLFLTCCTFAHLHIHNSIATTYHKLFHMQYSILITVIHVISPHFIITLFIYYYVIIPF